MPKNIQDSKKKIPKKIKTERGKRLYELMSADKTKKEMIRDLQIKVIVSLVITIVILYFLKYILL
ncbi:MAG: hypothetical protein GQ477_04955 [Nanohaloarchaea archaeon]|nr:hypothetical protein [Candidatus Nanohaloarchaea archaeon]